MAAFAAPITATKAATAVATPVALGRAAAVPHVLPEAKGGVCSAGSILPAAAAVLGSAALVTASASRRRQRANGAARRSVKVRAVPLGQSAPLKYDGSKFDAAVFEGGGTKGIVYAGALKRLQEAGLMEGITRFAGTSAGSQAALLAALGYTGEEVQRIMLEAPWATMVDRSGGPFGFVANGKRLFKEFGVCKGDNLKAWIEGLVEAKTGNKETTFKELFEFNGNILRCGSCDVTKREFTFLDKESYPDMPIALAARASSSIPIVFVPVKWQKSRFVDGCLQGNLPITAFPGKRTLGFHLTTAQALEFKKTGRDEVESLGDFVGTVVDMIMNAANDEAGMNATDESASSFRNIGVDVINIKCGDVGTLETKVDEERVQYIAQKGYDAVDVYLGDKSTK